MQIELKEITIRELVEGYHDDGESGVVGYSGKLDIRPPYQRNFVYKDKQRNAVIETVRKGFPLNVMYWAVRDDGTFEIIDGQQRTISVAQYVGSEFSIDDRYFHNLRPDEREQILDYKAMVYVCTGTETEKLEWFKTINIAGEKLFDQELRNAVYHGPWVSDAKRYFSMSGCAAYEIGSDYLSGSAIRQDYLETAIKWVNDGNVERYMSERQHDQSAVSLWNYFQSVINWIEATFTNKRRKYMRGVNWGSLYNSHKDDKLDPVAIEEEAAKLFDDDDVSSKSGIYPYILTRNEKYLNIRAFTPAMRQKVYEKQNGKCFLCGEPFDITAMEGDHIKPWSKGGKTDEDNCQMLCRECNRTKSAK